MFRYISLNVTAVAENGNTKSQASQRYLHDANKQWPFFSVTVDSVFTVAAGESTGFSGFRQ